VPLVDLPMKVWSGSDLLHLRHQVRPMLGGLEIVEKIDNRP
jgi:hypothetical protein